MNFLSTGEKIKRARIYKGVTLKELCKKDVSISKMSCIENDKIKAEQWILEMVAERLDLDIQYLLFDDIMELESSIKNYESLDVFTENDFLAIKERLEYCLAKGYKDLAFKFIHILFEVYTKRKKFEGINELISTYNELHEDDAYQKQVYYEDLAKYFLAKRNYSDAITYLNRAISHIVSYTISKNMDCYIKNNFLLAKAYYLTNDYNKCEEILKELLYLEDKIKSDEYIALINGLMLTCRMKLNKDITANLEKFDSYKHKEKITYCAVELLIAENYFEQNNQDKALDIILDIKEKVKSNNSYAYTELLLYMVEILLNNEKVDVAKEMSEEALEISIKLDSQFLIERSYLYKARINRVNRSLIQWEMNMNLATDILVRFASVEEKRQRYIEMAEMYHIIGETRETIKYLTLAMNLEKIISI